MGWWQLERWVRVLVPITEDTLFGKQNPDDVVHLNNAGKILMHIKTFKNTYTWESLLRQNCTSRM